MKKINLNSWLMTFLILASVPVSQTAIDMYLPSLPAMAQSLHASATSMQLTLTVYILTVGCSQLIYGPLSDRFGRRTVFIWAFTIFLISTLFCMTSHAASHLLIARFFQGLGGGCGFVISNSMMADLFTGKKLARLITYGSLTWSLTPIIAPVLGGLIQQYLGWRVNFLVMFIYGFLLWLAVCRYMPETLPKEKQHPIHPKILFQSYLSILANQQFLGLIICVAFSYGAVIAFNVTGPFILQEALHISAALYGFVVLFVGLAYALGTYLNSLLLKKWPMMQILGWGIMWTCLSGLLLILFSAFHWFSVTSIIIGTFILQISQGLVFANCLSCSLTLFGQQNGSVSALFGCFILIGCSAISAIVSTLHIVNQIPLGLVYLILGILATLGYLLALKNTTLVLHYAEG